MSYNSILMLHNFTRKTAVRHCIFILLPYIPDPPQCEVCFLFFFPPFFHLNDGFSHLPNLTLSDVTTVGCKLICSLMMTLPQC